MESTQLYEEVPPIKEQLIVRFLAAREALGKKWRTMLSEADPYFYTKPGVEDMTLVAAATLKERRRGQVDRIKRVVLAMEKLAGIPHVPIL